VTDPLEIVTREAREAPGPKVDWSRVDARLLERVRAEVAVERQAARVGSARRAWIPVAGGLAAAAAVALCVVSLSRGRGPATVEATAPTVDRSAGSLVEGEAFVAGRPRSRGATIALGDVLEARGARAVFLRPAGAGRGEVVFAVEEASRATVTRVDGALVLALDQGAVEAQVGPEGEGFAVDVGVTRVVAHASHLRVARQADYAIVDLSEGAVSIGAPLRAGTAAQLVAAPAHVEFLSGDAAKTMRIDHAAASVRPALVVAAEVATTVPPASATLAQLTAPPPRAPSAPPVATVDPRPEPPVIAVDPNADSTIAQAVHACLAARPAAPDVVGVTVTTELTITLNKDGTVQLARFSPPIAPDAQSCVTGTIYRTRFSHGGSVSIPIDYQK
jgi:hypothetical protein